MHTGATPDGSGIAGLYENHAYLIDHDRFLPFDAPDSTLTNAYDVNPQGEIVGHFRDSSGRFHGFFRDEDGEFTVLDIPGSNNVQARGINARGDIVGWYVDSSGRMHGFIARPCGGSNDRSGRARAFRISCNHDLTERNGIMVRQAALLVACSLPFLSRGCYALGSGESGSNAR